MLLFRDFLRISVLSLQLNNHLCYCGTDHNIKDAIEEKSINGGRQTNEVHYNKQKRILSDVVFFRLLIAASYEV